ncbi:hypothetical protein [Nitrosopumilus piranensis]|uniref:hypothetical protein n=1 Tax=Nitrosopumilus piranensis TaxID=1582439 RepID=UPI0011E6079A|nr:hypothetical protein [Nitrosopumilus piranensis]
MTTDFQDNSFMMYQIVENVRIHHLFLIPVLTYFVFFIVWIITREYISINLENLIYDWPKKGLVKIIDSNTKKDILGFFLLSTVITGFVWYVLGISTSEAFLAIVPFTEFVPELQVPCEALAEISDNSFGDIEYVLLLVGPIWVLILKQSRKYEIRNSIKKQRGMRTLVLFFWASIALFVADNNFELGCEDDRPSGWYLAPPGPAYNLYSDMLSAMIYGGLITLFIFVLNKYFEKWITTKN